MNEGYSIHIGQCDPVPVSRLESLQRDIDDIGDRLNKLSARTIALAERIIGPEPCAASDKHGGIKGVPSGAVDRINGGVHVIRDIVKRLESDLSRLELL